MMISNIYRVRSENVETGEKIESKQQVVRSMQFGEREKLKSSAAATMK
jgi:hypothetical protein